jgi:hypothetical protein
MRRGVGSLWGLTLSRVLPQVGCYPRSKNQGDDLPAFCSGPELMRTHGRTLVLRE